MSQSLVVSLKNMLPDKLYLKLRFKKVFGRKLNLTSPKTFNEKLQWLKLYNRRPEFSIMVDKYAVKEYVANIIGQEYIIPTLGVWNSPDEIDFLELPNRFVLKCTHNSGLGMYICKDKSQMDESTVKEELKKGIQENYYITGREWPYKNVPRRIIAEQYLDDDGHVPVDYKVYCFNGVPYKVMLCIDRDKPGATKFYSFDKEWNLLRHNKLGKNAPEGFTLPKPINFKKMFEFAAILSKDIPFLRVDFYDVNGQLYFGELTFYPDSGFDNAILPEIDQLYGEKIQLPNRKENSNI